MGVDYHAAREERDGLIDQLRPTVLRDGNWDICFASGEIWDAVHQEPRVHCHESPFPGFPGVNAASNKAWTNSKIMAFGFQMIR